MHSFISFFRSDFVEQTDFQLMCLQVFSFLSNLHNLIAALRLKSVSYSLLEVVLQIYLVGNFITWSIEANYIATIRNVFFKALSGSK